jgi:hypothetical protein
MIAASVGLVAIVAVSTRQLAHSRPIAPRIAPTLAEIFSDVPQAVRRVDQPRTGEREVLPPAVVAMLSLLEEHDVRAYRWSARIGSSPRLRQRIVEAAWPRRPEPDAPFLLSFAIENDEKPAKAPAGCEQIDSVLMLDATLGVSLARCR